MNLFKIIGDWAEQVQEESIEKDSLGVMILKSAGIGLLEGGFLGCAVIGAVGVSKSIIETIIKK